MARTRILFVCAGNTCRSPLAAALANSQLEDVSAESAGILPGFAIAANTVVLGAELAEADLSNHRPRGLDDVELSSFDLVVALDSMVADDLVGELADTTRLVPWSIPDPYGGSMDDYRRCANEIAERLGDLIG